MGRRSEVQTVEEEVLTAIFTQLGLMPVCWSVGKNPYERRIQHVRLVPTSLGSLGLEGAIVFRKGFNLIYAIIVSLICQTILDFDTDHRVPF